MSGLERIKRKLLRNEVDNALDQLYSDYILNSDQKRTLELAISKKAKIDSDRSKGLISYGGHNIELNQLNNSIFNVINELELQSNSGRKKKIKFSIIGFVEVGKTVFISILLNELLIKKWDSYIVEPSDDRTLKTILLNIERIKTV